MVVTSLSVYALSIFILGNIIVLSIALVVGMQKQMEPFSLGNTLLDILPATKIRFSAMYC